MYDKNKNYDCPMLITRDIIGGKWKMLILWRLSKNKWRFSQLKNQIPNITQKMLTKQLRELEADGVIIRKVYPQVPPKVEYELSEIGKTIIPVLNTMAEWGYKYIELQEENKLFVAE